MPGHLLAQKNYGDGKIFSVIIYDLIYDNVDCIVNAANGGLSHGGGVAAQISKAAGPDFDDECMKLIAEEGRISVGEARLTGAGNLPFKGVIHCVGPKKGERLVDVKLKNTLVAAFTIADLNEWNSLAFPAVSSGIFAVSHLTCVEAYIKAVEDFFTEHEGTFLKEIHLCLYKGPIADRFTRHVANKTGWVVST